MEEAATGEKPAEKAGKPAENPAGKAVEESAEKQSAEPAEKAVEKPAEAQPAESAEKAVEEPAEKLPGTTAVAGGERKNTDENSKHDAGAAAGKSQDSPGAAAGSQSPDSAGAAAGRHTQGSLKEFAVGSSPVDPPEPPRKRSSAGRIAFLLSLLTILLVLGGIYYYGYQYCGTHFMPGTRINLFDCSGLTEDEVHERFAEAAENYVINVRFRGGTTEMLSAKDIGFTYQPDGSIAALLQEQDQMLWPKYFFEENGYTIDVGGNYDDDKLMAALQALPELQKDNMEEPENAYIRFRDGKGDEDGAFEIVPDTPGSKIDAIQLAAAVGDAAARYEEMLDAEEIEGAYISADVPADDTKLVTRCKDLNEIVGASITYVMPDGEEIKLNADVMKNWLVEDKKGRLVKDDDVWDQHLWDFLQELAN
ncbi:MAG: hypothetical protein Q4F43_05865, partial [Eubacteriales bacterium]|nr:hypothetical protein [Eubacteriales bacterium]